MSRRALPRLRLRRAYWPRPALVVTDTPRPGCPLCGGRGEMPYDYGHPVTGEYEGTGWEPCPCFNEARHWVLLPLPRRLHRAAARDSRSATTDYSDEPPF